MLSQIPWSMLNGTTCPKSQPAILDQTIFKLRIFKLKTFSYKVQCSKDIIFTVITSAQTRVSVLNSHKFDKNMGFFISKKKKKKEIITLRVNAVSTASPHQPVTPCSASVQGLPQDPMRTRSPIHPSNFSHNGPYSNHTKYLNYNLKDLYLDIFY